MKRIRAFDGIRGIAALIVVVAHLICAFAPEWYFGGDPLSDVILRSPLFVLWSGQFAVAVFFVLSGYVIAGSVRNLTVRMLAPTVLSRYLRLALPMLTGSAFAFLLVAAFPGAAQEAAEITGSVWLGWHYQEPVPPFSAMVFEALGGAFLGWSYYFNSVLWTMRYELIGSLVLYFAIATLGPAFSRYALAAATMALLWFGGDFQHLAAIGMGAILYFSRDAICLRHQGFAYLALAGALLLGSFPFVSSDGTLYASLSAVFPNNTGTISRAIGAVLLLISVQSIRPFTSLLEGPIPQFLGRVSFPLYLLHVPVIGTLLSAGRVTSDGVLFALQLGAGVGGILLLSFVMTIALDEPLVRGLRRLRRGRGSAEAKGAVSPAP